MCTQYIISQHSPFICCHEGSGSVTQKIPAVHAQYQGSKACALEYGVLCHILYDYDRLSYSSSICMLGDGYCDLTLAELAKLLIFQR